MSVAVGAGSVAAQQRSHVVQFYRRDEELASSVGHYLAGAILAGGAAVLVATPPHAEVITAAMQQAGADLPAARRAGRFLALDAESLLSRFVTGGRVDRAAFLGSVGVLIRQAGARGPVAVYGEMVAVLWSAGDVMAAAELEGLWNDLARQTPFSLYCGYPDRFFDADPEARARLCQLHTAVIGTDPVLGPEDAQRWRAPVSQAFECVRDAPRAARHFVLHLLRQWHLDGGHGAAGPAGAEARSRLVADAALVVTELATNAVLHAGSAFTVSAALSEDAIYLSVTDNLPLPAAQAGLPVWPDHGLGVIAEIADRWGVAPAPGGKAVWASLRLPG